MLTGDASVNSARADHRLHGRGAGEHRAARGRGRGHRPGRDGRVPLLRRRRSAAGRGRCRCSCLPQAQFLLMSATLGDVARLARGPHPPHRPRDRAGRRRRAPRPAGLHAGRSSRCTSCSRSWSRPTRRRSTSSTSRRPPRWSARSRCCRRKLCTREERDAIADAIGAFRFTAGFGKTLSKLVRSGIGVHHAGMLPRYRRLVEQLAQTGLLKVDLRHRHARRRHQRPDPHRRLHRAGEVRRHQPPAAEGARVPPDRGPRRPRRVRHRRATWSCRRPSTRSRTRARAGQGRRRPEEGASASRRSRPPDGVGQLDRGDVRAAAQRDARGARLAHAGQPRDDPQRHQPARATPDETMRALMEDNHEDERGRGAAGRAGRVAAARSCSTSGVLERLEEPDERRPHAAARARRCRRTSRSTSRWRRSPRPRSTLLDPESETLHARRAVGRRVDPRRPVPGADGAGQEGARRGGRRR